VVEVTNYSALDIEVEIECACPPGTGLEHAGGVPWKPEARRLDGSLYGVSGTRFEEQLRVAGNARVPAREQLTLVVRRRRPSAKRWTWQRTMPLKDLQLR
jgi:hypothetical protein